MSETTLHEAIERIDSLTAALRDTNENFLNARDHAEAAEARAQKAENEHRVMNNRLFELRDRAQKAEAVLRRIADEGHANPKDAIIELARNGVRAAR